MQWEKSESIGNNRFGFLGVPSWNNQSRYYNLMVLNQLMPLLNFTVTASNFLLFWFYAWIGLEASRQFYQRSRYLQRKVHSRENSFVHWHLHKRSFQFSCIEVLSSPMIHFICIDIFYTRTHADYHGSLATYVALFTISVFNQSCCYLTNFTKFKQIQSMGEMDDHHWCLQTILEGVNRLH